MSRPLLLTVYIVSYGATEEKKKVSLVHTEIYIHADWSPNICSLWFCLFMGKITASETTKRGPLLQESIHYAKCSGSISNNPSSFKSDLSHLGKHLEHMMAEMEGNALLMLCDQWESICWCGKFSMTFQLSAIWFPACHCRVMYSTDMGRTGLFPLPPV